MTNKTVKQKLNIKYMAACAILAALTSICSQIAIPLPYVPINLALFAVHTAGALLGGFYGTVSMVIYVLLGAVGAPVFQGFGGGIAKLLGPTGGYIWGYIFCALVVGIITRAWGKTPIKTGFAMACGTLTCYAFGTAWFIILTKTDLWAALITCVIPFLAGDAVKIVLAVLLCKGLEKPLAKIGFTE